MGLHCKMDAPNTYQVSARLWTSGQLSERDIAELPRLGIESVINLALPTSPNALRGEDELVSGQGMDYFHIPVLWEQPALSQLETFFSIMDVLQGKKVWVHCALNMRVSAFIYLYRKLQLQETDDEAAYPMREIWQPNEVWQAFIAKAAL